MAMTLANPQRNFPRERYLAVQNRRWRPNFEPRANRRYSRLFDFHRLDFHRFGFGRFGLPQATRHRTSGR